MELDKISPDILIKIALEYDMPELLSLCLTNSRINHLLCENSVFWMNKLARDFPKTYNKLQEMGNKNWKQYYKRANSVSKGKYTSFKIYTSEGLYSEMMKQYTPKWANPSGLLPDDMRGWTLRKDKYNSEIAYFYPGSYYKLSPMQIPKEGENHPTIMLKISFPQPIIEEIPWDDSVLGELLHYRRGDGKISWFNDLYEIKIEFDGGIGDPVFNVYLYPGSLY